MGPTYPQQHGTYIYIYDFIMFYWNFGANTPVRAVVVAKRPENTERERDISFDEHIHRERKRGISILMKIYTERERGISILMNIYTEKEREGYQF